MPKDVGYTKAGRPSKKAKALGKKSPTARKKPKSTTKRK